MDKRSTTDGTRTFSATSEQIHEFRARFIEDSDLLRRTSTLLWFDMLFGYKMNNLDCDVVMDAVFNLENGEPHSGIKPSSQFNHHPLKGLWHKHYFPAQSLIRNARLGHGKNGLEKLVDEIMEPAKHKIVTQLMINELVSRSLFEPLAKRSGAGRLTGEWVIFAKNAGANYYLSLGIHRISDEIHYDRIIEHCVYDFPDLLNWFG